MCDAGVPAVKAEIDRCGRQVSESGLLWLSCALQRMLTPDSAARVLSGAGRCARGQGCEISPQNEAPRPLHATRPGLISLCGYRAKTAAHSTKQNGLNILIGSLRNPQAQ